MPISSIKILNLTKQNYIMSTIEMKSDLYKILDKIENEQLLRTVYDFLKQSENVEEGQIWKTLNEDQKKEVYLSYEESQDDKNLIDWENVKKKF
jgi:hypothetical protein